MKTLIVYYSFTGNTEKIAKMISEEINADTVRIETVKPYKGNYNEVVEQGHREVNSDFMPEIKSLSVDISDYDTIIIGSPVWWYTFAPAVKTFLTENDFSNKNICIYATNAGWLGHTLKDFTALCKNKSGKILNGISIKFNGSDLLTDKTEIKNWLKNIK